MARSPKRKNPTTPSTAKIMASRARMVRPSSAKTPWHPSEPLRNAVIALRKLERKFEREYKLAEKRIDKLLAKFKKMDPKVKERRKEVMLKKAKATTQGRLIRKATKLQDRIDRMTENFRNMNAGRLAA